ncbi:FAD-dependent oxidoreductase [Anatilimnocola sp. NA78]|uniref:FAD-dependent oxidoreductase n=1 Tax=Anatilimnocola sp. NA78 TaxID=3415683 RepID=UPI003CE45EC7
MNHVTAASRWLIAGVLLISWLALASAAPATGSYDIVVYGGTAGGVAAAVQARRMGKTALIIEPSQHLGGLTSGGLGATDIGNKAAIGGISREFYQHVRKHYSDPANWTQEKPENYKSGRGSEGLQEDAMWTFEPRVAEKILRKMCADEKVEVVYGQRLNRKDGLQKDGKAITSIRMESGEVYAGKMFLDATYEGDLFALAGCSYHVGREANSVYGETLNGVQVKNARHHQLVDGVDPYVKKGDKSSGLLPGVHGDSPGEEGSGDKRVQAYNFRMCLTDRENNKIPFSKPEGYDPARYELLLRNFEAGETRAPWAPVLMPNRKTDVNNNHGFASDNINMNYDYPEADYAKRDEIFKEHLQYQRGLMWTLVSNPRVPEKIRNEVSRWGLCKDEFPEHAGWPHQMYVREARRLISDYVMTQNDCQGRRVCDDPVGLGAYNMDSHNVQRYVDAKGQVKNEGDVQVGVSPYPISYKSIIAAEKECSNLLVPVNLSSSHIAFGSIRMEPVFMVLGQSAATAACLAIDDKVTVQKVDYKKLNERLLADKQVLVWTGAKRGAAGGVDPKTLKGIVVDDDAAKVTGGWGVSSSTSGYIGSQYLHDGDAQKGQLSAQFVINVDKPGDYDVRLAYTAFANRATNVPVTIKADDVEKEVKVNQRKPAEGGFVSLGKFPASKSIVVTINNAGTDGHVIADAVQAIPVK